MMKVCPKCRTQYTDLTLRFCLQDGAELVLPTDKVTEEFDAAEFSDAATIAVDASPTESAGASETAPEEFLSQQTVIRQLPVKRKSRSGFLLGLAAGVVTLLAVVAIGLGVWFLPDLLNKEKPKPKMVERQVRLSKDEFKKVTASSVRKKDGDITYVADNAFDNDENTAWCEGVKGPGKGEWIRVDFKKPEKLVELRIKPGYFKNLNVWGKNNRVASIDIRFSDGTERVYEFPDAAKSRVISLPKIETDFVKVSIRDIYPGKTDRFDTLITDVGFSAVKMVEDQSGQQ